MSASLTLVRCGSRDPSSATTASSGGRESVWLLEHDVPVGRDRDAGDGAAAVHSRGVPPATGSA